MTPLLPKLRGYFAEFLRESYLAPLSILYLPTCVGYGTGIVYFDSASFSWKYDIDCFNAVASGTHVLTQNGFAISQHLERLNR